MKFIMNLFVNTKKLQEITAELPKGIFNCIIISVLS